MALLKLSGLATAISGKLGGSIFGTSANGSYIKQNSYSQQHATQLQQERRTQIYQTSQLWRSLTPTQKASWDSATIAYPYTNKVGDVVYYTGYQLFNYLNQNLLLVNGTPIASPPIFASPILPTVSMFVISTSQINISFSGNGANQGCAYYLSPPMPANTATAEGLYRLVTTYNAFSANLSNNMTGLYAQKFRTPLVGERIFLKTKFISLTKGINTGLSLEQSKIVV